jgi:hypothetical protein
MSSLLLRPVEPKYPPHLLVLQDPLPLLFL